MVDLAAEKRSKERERRDAAEAFDRMCATRPLKPPPFRFEGSSTTAGALAARKDRRIGVLLGTSFLLGRTA